MNKNTKTRIEFLQKYVREHYKTWHKMDPKNIVGFRVDKKISNGEPLRSYSIIFQVKNKRTLNKIKNEMLIPSHLSIQFPDGTIKKIKTDVQQTGNPELHMGECRKPKKNGKIEVGTAGVILKNDTDNFALTNYHVAAIDRMETDEFDFLGEDPNIFVDGDQATFVEGIFSNELDIAFIRLSTIPGNPNLLDDGVQIGGFANGPLTTSLINKKVVIYSKNMRLGKPAAIKNNSAVFFTNFRGLSLEDLIQITPRITIKGDSGGIVLINEDVLLGIIVGADDLFSYAIPFFKIANFKPLTIA